MFENQDGETASYVGQLTAAMSANEDYSVILQSGESRRHLYCTGLSYCDWSVNSGRRFALPVPQALQKGLGVDELHRIAINHLNFAIGRI